MKDTKNEAINALNDIFNFNQKLLLRVTFYFIFNIEYLNFICVAPALHHFINKIKKYQQSQ